MDTSSDVQRCLDELGLQSYSSADLMSFTSNFLESNKIGSGGYGEVYKGQLLKGVLIAVKVLENMDVVEDTFMAEVCTMGKARHRNLIKLYGYCFEDNMKALVYEYMENGSLDKILYENNHGGIEWVKLYGIANDIANGLNYLHDGLEEQIIHFDIKAANVLLSKNLSAKLTDFGLAKIMNRDISCVDVSRIRGTHGYIAPELWTPGSQVSCKCDVYSFGMMLFEILGKKSNGKEKDWFPVIVWKQFENGTLDQLLRDCGIIEKDRGKAIILSKVALCCAHHIPEQRPSMMEVVLMLKENLPVWKPSYPFLPMQFSKSSMVPSQEGFPQVSLEAPLAISKRKWVDSQEQDLNIYPSYASITGGGNNGPEDDGGVTLPQLKSNVPKKLSPDILEEDMATLVPNKGMKLPTTKLVGKTTALKYKEIILQLIAKDEAVTIGVHGMGGVGKTTIFKHVHNQLLAEPNRFDKIIWVIVSQDGNIIKLQNDLAKELDLKLLLEDDVFRRSRLLLQALEKRKRVVFFFDDVWTTFSLDEIGIPEPTQENGFKIILSTRLLDVCRRMGCHKDNTITVKGLPEDEAWELFMDKIDCVLSPQVEKIVEMVVKKCSGLPLAIITIGGAMRRNSDIDEWRVALNDLNLRDPSNRIMNLEDNVYECLKFSYDRLENEKQRKCFLCCALYPEDWHIETRDLVDFWIMDGIVEGINRQDELAKGQYILNKLKDHCLLESINPFRDIHGKMFDGVKIHDSIREMALCLTNKCFMVKNGPSFKELPNEMAFGLTNKCFGVRIGPAFKEIKELPSEEEWEIVLERASFMDGKIKSVSISPICPNLSTFILEGSLLETVKHNFFVHMKCLKVLDLRCYASSTNYDLKSLPDSISDLVNLRALRLGGYKSLKKLPSLAKLVLLRRLELNNTGIEELPEGMEILVNLRCLNLFQVPLKERIPIGLISKFSLLQELYLGGRRRDKLYEFGRGESFAKELLSLRELENLSVTFRCVPDYCSYVGSPKFKGLNCFFLAIGNGNFYNEDYPDPPCSTTIHVFDPPDEHIALVFPKNTKHVKLTSFHDLIRLNELKECIWSSKDENQEFSACWLRSLEEITIDNCRKLYTIFEGIPNYISGVLPVFCLKELTVSYCHNLKNVFPSSRLLQLLQNLEEINISECDELDELIGDDAEEEETETLIEIPRLKELCIGYLPKLKRVWSGVMICDSLDSIKVIDCNKLKSLPQLKGEEQSTPPALRSIEGGRKWWDSLEWDPAYPKNILQPFFKVNDCFDPKSEEEDSSMSEGENETNCFDSKSDEEDSSMSEGENETKAEAEVWPDGEDSLMVEAEKNSQSDECAPEGAGIDREESDLSGLIMTMTLCDSCEICLLGGKWYKCKDCWGKRVLYPERIYQGFDLCEECYNTPSKQSNLVNQYHTQEHTFELITIPLR